MTEELPKGPEKAKEKNWEDMTPEEQEAFCNETMPGLGDVAKRHPEILTGKILPENRKETKGGVELFRKMVSHFKETYSLEALHAITDLNPFDPEDVAKYPIRVAAKESLVGIVLVLEAIEIETDITRDELEKIKQEYYEISRAVGIINNKKVDHTRML